MSNHNSAQVLLQLTTTLKYISKVTIETTYGLVVVVNPDKSITVQQTTARKPDSEGESSRLPNPEPQSQEKPLGYKYRVFPEYLDTFVWYDSTWPGNPEDDFNVDEDELMERYGEAWNKAYDDWRERYIVAFEEQECQLGSYQHPFPDKEERRAWVVEGLLLVCWLSLQPDVENVEYGPDAEKVDFNKGSVDATLQSFLEEIEKYLT
ncbi:hypothetical protein PG993_005866 [Apiospora rasikravindrae]|uniref:Uncharacterized protein n=1 Tax=Apiospora rasikravindrae TaxID=990691 RepID=A0ABR1TA00_9PEZI